MSRLIRIVGAAERELGRLEGCFISDDIYARWLRVSCRKEGLGHLALDGALIDYEALVRFEGGFKLSGLWPTVDLNEAVKRSRIARNVGEGIEFKGANAGDFAAVARRLSDREIPELARQRAPYSAFEDFSRTLADVQGQGLEGFARYLRIVLQSAEDRLSGIGGRDLRAVGLFSLPFAGKSVLGLKRQCLFLSERLSRGQARFQGLLDSPDEDAWLAEVAARVSSAAADARLRVGSIERAWSAFEQKNGAKRRNSVAPAVCALFQDSPVQSTGSVRRSLGIDKKEANRVLKRLEGNGLLRRKNGRSPDQLWISDALLHAAGLVKR